MSELPAKKFQYKNDQKDNLIIWVVILTVVCFAGLIYGSRYLNEKKEYIESDHRPGLRDFEHNKQELEKQINDYIQDRDFDSEN